jgi:hypothetical protein
VGVLSAAVADVNNISHHHERDLTPSCTAKDNFIFTSYSVNLPVHYNGSDFCNGLFNLIRWGQYPLNPQITHPPPARALRNHPMEQLHPSQELTLTRRSSLPTGNAFRVVWAVFNFGLMHYFRVKMLPTSLTLILTRHFQV